MDRIYRNELDSNYIDEIKETPVLILFGASKWGETVSNQFLHYGVSINDILFCDNNKEIIGSYINAIKVIAPNQIQQYKNAVVVICSSSYKEEMRKQLLTLGIKERVYEYSIDNAKDIAYTYRILNRKKNAKNSAHGIEILKELLADDESKEVLDNVIKYRATKDLQFLFRIGNIEEYFVKNIIKLGENEVFVDAGAYTGDTIDGFIEACGGKYKAIYAFEPDTKNFKDLSWYARSKNWGRNVILEQKGVYYCNKKINFCNDHTMGARIDVTASEDSVEVVKLDDYFKDEKVTFIKMDIEGSEYQALLGAKGIIQRDKPKLAICVYHNTEDLWELPLLIKEILPEYKIYLRHHGIFEPYEKCDTICYATI